MQEGKEQKEEQGIVFSPKVLFAMLENIQISMLLPSNTPGRLGKYIG